MAEEESDASLGRWFAFDGTQDYVDGEGESLFSPPGTITVETVTQIDKVDVNP